MTIFKKILEFISTARIALKKKGVKYMIQASLKIVFLYPWYKQLRSSKVFIFQGKPFPYFVHYYNLTWENERAIEVPIVWSFVEQYREKNILEVGNVLANYFPVQHDILDKYEEAPGVINEDVCDFKPSQKYDLIVSLSTLEHVGWDEEPREPMKVLKAFENLKTLLAPQGKLVVTWGLGYNPAIDDLWRKEQIPFTKTYCLKRISRDNQWREVDRRDVERAEYGRPLPYANAVVIGIIEKK